MVVLNDMHDEGQVVEYLADMTEKITSKYHKRIYGQENTIAILNACSAGVMIFSHLYDVDFRDKYYIIVFCAIIYGLVQLYVQVLYYIESIPTFAYQSFGLICLTRIFRDEPLFVIRYLSPHHNDAVELRVCKYFTVKCDFDKNAFETDLIAFIDKCEKARKVAEKEAK